MKNWLNKDPGTEKKTIPQEFSCDDAHEIFDYPNFLNRVMGDEELAMSILQEFMNLIDQHADKLRKGIESGDHETVRQISHMIKGESGNISASSLYECAYTIETSAKNLDRDRQHQMLPVLFKAIDNLKKAINNVLK